MLSVVLPLPVPDEGFAATHDGRPDTLQAHPADALIATSTELAAAGAL